METRFISNANRNISYNDNNNGNRNRNYNCNHNGNSNGNINNTFNRKNFRNGNRNINYNSTRGSRGRTRQSHDPPNPTRDEHCWTHEKNINDLHTSVVCRYPDIGHESNATLYSPQDFSTFVMEWQGGAYLLIKTQSKINTKLIFQHPVQNPPSSHNSIVYTGANKHF